MAARSVADGRVLLSLGHDLRFHEGLMVVYEAEISGRLAAAYVSLHDSVPSENITGPAQMPLLIVYQCLSEYKLV